MPVGRSLELAPGVSVRGRGSAHVSRLRFTPGVGNYFQRVMNSTTAALTTSGSEALRKC
jgi:hypothetical protein